MTPDPTFAERLLALAARLDSGLLFNADREPLALAARFAALAWQALESCWESYGEHMYDEDIVAKALAAAKELEEALG